MRSIFSCSTFYMVKLLQTYISISISHQPSKGSPVQQEAKEIDKGQKKLFVNSKVRSAGVLQTKVCIYALKKLTSAESALVEEIDGSKLCLWITITSVILSIL